MTRINGHWDEPSSGTWGHPFTVSQSADCVLRIQILPAKHGSSKTKVCTGSSAGCSRHGMYAAARDLMSRLALQLPPPMYL